MLSVKEKLKAGKVIEDLPLKVVFYARVSTDHELQATSIVNQTEYFKSYIKSHENWIFMGGYVDEGISGKSVKKRENFLKMIQDAQLKCFDLILTKSVSRFARNTIDSIHYTDVLLQYGVGVLFLNDNINTFYSDSEFRLTLMASIAQDELRKLSESVQFGLNQSIERGIVLGNNNILGYQKNHGKLVIIEEEASIVRDIFKLYATNQYNYLSLSKEINSRYGLHFDSSRIKRILTNYKYKGYYCGRKSRIVDYKKSRREYIDSSKWVVYKNYEVVPPIVDDDLWNLVQNIILKRKKVKDYCFNLYKNNIYCGIHLRKLIIKKKKYKNKCYIYFVCPHCLHFSISLLDRIFKIHYFKKVFVFKSELNSLHFLCQK